MDIRQLRYYKEIVDQGSISKAAEALNMAQPPLSMLLRQLEEKYGMSLIKRYREKWEVTEAGQMLYEHAVQVLQQMEMFDVKMGYMMQGESGQLRMGVSSSCLHLIGETIRDYTLRFPQVQLQLLKGDSAKLEHMLFNNEIDMAIILAPENMEYYESIALTTVPFALAVPNDWYEHITSNSFSIQKIKQYPLVSLEAMEGYTMLENIIKYLENENIPLNIVAKCKDITIAQYLVANQVGISILPKIETGQYSELRYIDLPQLDTTIQPMVVYKKEALLSQICKNFITFLH